MRQACYTLQVSSLPAQLLWFASYWEMRHRLLISFLCQPQPVYAYSCVGYNTVLRTISFTDVWDFPNLTFTAKSREAAVLFMNTKKFSGPCADSCGIPEATLKDVEQALSISTNHFLSLRWVPTQYTHSGVIRTFCSLWMREQWGTWSKAFVKHKDVVSSCWLLFTARVKIVADNNCVVAERCYLNPCWKLTTRWFRLQKAVKY